MIGTIHAQRVRDSPELDEAGLRRLSRARTPARIPGLASSWAALERWTPEHMLDLALRSPDAEVPVRRTPLDQPTLDVEGVHLGRMQLAQFMTRALLAGEHDELYMAGINVSSFEAFAADFRRPALLTPAAVGPSLFAGRNTRCLGHYHARTQALLVQVQGRKQVLLYPPSACSKLDLVPAHAEGFWRSRINFHATGQVRTEIERGLPIARDATAWVTWLEPGDALFIPVHWLHVPWGPGWSVSLTWWWRAALPEWSFPTPGLRTALGISLEYARRKLGQVGQVDRGAHA